MHPRVARSLTSVSPTPGLPHRNPAASGRDQATRGRSPWGARAAVLVVLAAMLGVGALMLGAERPDAATFWAEDGAYPPKLITLLRAF